MKNLNEMTDLWNRMKHFAADQRGSAVLEFVALALPLFIPLFLFLNQYSMTSDTEASMRTLGREMSRAIVTSENDEVAFGVAAEVFAKGGEILGFEDEIYAGDIRYSIECQRQPCISPNNEIEVKIISRELGRSISAVEYVSPWA
jgi:hypothetical protein